MLTFELSKRLLRKLFAESAMVACNECIECIKILLLCKLKKQKGYKKGFPNMASTYSSQNTKATQDFIQCWAEFKSTKYNSYWIV